MAKIFELAFQVGGKLGSSFSGAITSATGALQMLGQRVKELERGQADVSRFRALKQDAAETGKRMAAAQAECARLGAAMRAAETPSKALTNQFEAAKRKAGDLKDKLTGQNQELHKLRSSMQAAGGSTVQLIGHQNRLAKAADTARAAQSRLQSVMARQAANKAQREKMLGGIMSGPVGGALAGVGGALAVQNVMGPGVDFQHAMQLGGNTGGLSGADVAKTGEAIRSAARVTNQDLMGMTGAWQALIARGLDNQRSVDALGIIGKTATATGASIEDLAKTSFSLMDNLKIKTEDLGSVMDILAQAGKSGSFELKDMAQYFPQLTAGFRSLGIEGPEAAASMAAALQVAMKGAADPAEAASNMKNFLTKMSSPDTIKKFKEEYGINLEKALKGAMKRGENPVEFMLQMIQKATKGDKFRIGELFGDMQVLNFLTPMMQDMEEFKRIKTEALGAKGTVSKDFAAMLGTTKEQLSGVNNSAKDLAVSLGNSLSPAFGMVLGGLKPVLNFASDLAKRFPVVTAGVLGLAGAGIGLVTALSGIGLISNFAVGGFLALSKGLQLVRLSMVGVNLAFLANPITWVVAAIAGAAYVVYKFWGPISGFFKGLFLGIAVALEPLSPTFSRIGTLFSTWVVSPVKELFGWFTRLIEPAEGASAAWFNFGTRTGMVIGHFVASVAEVPGKITAIAQSLYESGAALVDTLIEGVKSRAMSFYETVQGMLAKVREMLPFSDAKTGPFSALTASGAAIMETLAQGVANTGAGPLTKQLAMALGGAQGTIDSGLDIGFGGGGKGGAANQGGGLGQVVINFSAPITINGEATPGALEAPLRESETRLREMIEQILGNDRRVSYA